MHGVAGLASRELAIKEVGGESLLHAVRSVAAGQSIFHPVVTCAMLTRLRAPATEHGPAAALSDKEQHVLELVAKGKTNKQIGTALALSPRTVKNYLSRIFQKLGVRARYAIVTSIIECRIPPIAERTKEMPPARGGSSSW